MISPSLLLAQIMIDIAPREPGTAWCAKLTAEQLADFLEKLAALPPTVESDKA